MNYGLLILEGTTQVIDTKRDVGITHEYSHEINDFYLLIVAPKQLIDLNISLLGVRQDEAIVKNLILKYFLNESNDNLLGIVDYEETDEVEKTTWFIREDYEGRTM